MKYATDKDLKNFKKTDAHLKTMTLIGILLDLLVLGVLIFSTTR